MKRTLIALFAFAFCAVAFGAGYSDWYTPAKSFSEQKADMLFYIGDKKIDVKDIYLNDDLPMVEAAVELAVANAGLSENAKNAFALGKRAVAEAMFAQIQSEVNRQKIDSLGASIETIFQLTNAQKIDASGNIISAGKLQDGVRTTLLNKKNSLIGATTPASGGGASGEGGKDKPLQITITKAPFNTNQFASRQDDGEAKQILKGSDALNEISGSSFPFSSGLYLATGWLPMLSDKDGTLTWKAWNGVDTGIIDVSAGTGGSDGKLQLKDWNGGTGGCELNVKGLLTDKESDDYKAARNSHYFLTRCKDGAEYKLHYMSVGGVIDSLTPVEPDEVSIETHINDDGTTNLCLYAVNEANEEVAESDTELGFIPYVDGGDTLTWAGFSEFFNPNVFTTDENGQIVLSGIEEAGEDDVMLVTARGTSTEQEVKVKKLDGNAFEAVEGNDLTLRGFKDTYDDYLFEDGDIAGLSEIPVKVVGDSGYQLEWRVWGGVDGGIFEANEDTDHLLSILGWNNHDHDCDTTLSAMMTDDDGDNRSKHYILTKYDNENVHWVPMGDKLDGGFPIDCVSVTTNSEDGAVNDGELSLFGFASADEEAGESETDIGFIPYADGGGTLAWAGLSEFFSDKVFDTTSDGRIILNGVSEEGSDKVRVLSVTGSGDEQEVSTVAFDNASVDGQIETGQIIQMHAFDTAPSPYGGYSTLNFADALTNASANINGMSIPVRYPAGNKVEIGYIPMGKVTGIPSASVDNLTIEATKDDDAGDNDPEKLRIVGAKEATKGQLLKMGDDGKVEWGDFPIEVDRPEGLEEDEYPLYITAADPEQDEPAKIGINGWNTYDSPEGLYGAGNGKPVTYRFADIKSLEADGDLRTIELAGYADAGNYSMAFKDSENGLGWVAPPSSGSALLTMNHGAEPTATVLGNSVETETLNNKVTLNIKGFTNGGGCDTTMSDMLTDDSQASNREHHQVLTRYSTGSGTPALHWVPMGDKVSGGGGADVDGVSITTNTANGAVTSGLASIYGFATAADGQVPTAAGDGSNKHIEWKKPTLKTGNYDYNETAHTVGGGYYVIGRTYQYCAGGTSVTGQGWMYLKVPMFWGSSSATCSMIFSTSQPPESDGEWTYVWLYYFNSNKEVVADYRNIPHIQAWE